MEKLSNLSSLQDVWRHALDRDGQVKLFEAEDFAMAPLVQ